MTTPPQAPPPIDEPSRTIGTLQEGLHQISDRLGNVEENQRQDRQATNAAFDSTNSRIDQNQLENNRRFDQVNARFDALNQRMDQLQQRTDRIFYGILGVGAVLGGLLIANIFF